MSIEEKLKQLGVTLPNPPLAIGSYVPCAQSGSLLFLSGVLPFIDGKLNHQGLVGKEIQRYDAKSDARQAVINALAIVKQAIGSLDNIKRCVKLTGYVASDSDFYDQHIILNG
ncbi:endoribonuclease L-PSP, partial [Candidatus Magnetoovum chiemensis]